MNWGRQLQAQYGELSTSIQDMGETPPVMTRAVFMSDICRNFRDEFHFPRVEQVCDTE
jgi:hypothetical protein